MPQSGSVSSPESWCNAEEPDYDCTDLEDAFLDDESSVTSLVHVAAVIRIALANFACLDYMQAVYPNPNPNLPAGSVHGCSHQGTGVLHAAHCACVTSGPCASAHFQVFCIHTEPNFSLPWQRKRQMNSTSSGFVSRAHSALLHPTRPPPATHALRHR